MYTLEQGQTRTTSSSSLWWRWVGASTLGVVIAFALFVVLYSIIGEPPEWLFPILMGGVGQQRVLRRVLGDARGWALATGVGFLIGLSVAVVIGEGDGLLAKVLAGAVHGIETGAIMGVLQYRVLRTRIDGARAWIPASMVVWLIGAMVADLVGYFVDGLDIIAGPVAAAAASGIVLI